MISITTIVVTLYILVLLVVVPLVLLRRHEAPLSIAWVLIVIFIPFFGALLFLVFGVRPTARGSLKKWPSSRKFQVMRRKFQGKWAHLRFENGNNPDRHDALMDLVAQLGFPPVMGNELCYSTDSSQMYEAMLAAIGSAETVINLDFYIFAPDEVGGRFADALIAKASEGVEVNLLYDGFGSSRLHGDRRFLKRLHKAGVRTASFASPGWIWPWYLNLRNHRKILVVDGRVAFTGGLNIGRVFTQEGSKHGVWKDGHVRIDGPAALHLQWVFAMDWYLATNQEILKESWFPRHDHKDGEIVQIQASGPDEEVESATLLLGTALACARRSVLICTPYLVPGQSVLNAMQAAALRGVELRLLVPHRSDHQIVTLAGRSYYQDLLVCGAHIHEYLPGVDHSKIVAIDDELVIVSSANMDIRSYTSSFEVSAIIYSESLSRQAADDFKKQLKDSKEITVRDFADRSLTERLKENGARLLSPFL